MDHNWSSNIGETAMLTILADSKEHMKQGLPLVQDQAYFFQ
jgi:hypothetical protein